MSHSPPQNRKLSRSVAKPVAPNRRHNSVASNFAQLSDKRKNPEQKIIENKVQIYGKMRFIVPYLCTYAIYTVKLIANSSHLPILHIVTSCSGNKIGAGC